MGRNGRWRVRWRACGFSTARRSCSGPWAAQQLGDLGADVIKIEPPEGDTTRQLGPARNPGMAAFYLGCNRSKRSIVLDLKQAAGRKALFKLAETADVFMHNYRPEPATRLGVELRGLREGQSAAGLSRAPTAIARRARWGRRRPTTTSSRRARASPRCRPWLRASRASCRPSSPTRPAPTASCRPCWRRSTRARRPARARRSRCRCSRRWSRSSWSSISTARLSGRRSNGGLQARAQQGAAALSVEGRLFRAAALHRRALGASSAHWSAGPSFPRIRASRHWPIA